MIKRELEETIKKYLKTKEIIAVLGPRQVGKTTLLKKIYAELKNAEFITFEDTESLDLFENDINEFIELFVEGNKYLFIDEVQYAKDSGKKLKYIFDTQDIKILISGSSATELSLHSIKALVGRIFIFHLYPCSFEEFLAYRDPKLHKLLNSSATAINKKILKHYQEFAIYGGYPRAITAKTQEEKELVLKNIYNTYLLKEIREILQLTADFKLTRLLKALALQIGNLINYEELSQISEFNRYEVKRNLNILKKTFVCETAQPYYTNKRTELSKTPKIFFYDNGFRNAVLRDYSPLDSRADTGAMNENFIATEIIKRELSLNYWRTKSKAEVDFVISKKSEVIPLEVKSKLTQKRLTKSFQSFLKKHQPKKALVASYSFKDSQKAQKTQIKYEPLYNVLNKV